MKGTGAFCDLDVTVSNPNKVKLSPKHKLDSHQAGELCTFTHQAIPRYLGPTNLTPISLEAQTSISAAEAETVRKYHVDFLVLRFSRDVVAIEVGSLQLGEVEGWRKCILQS